MNDTVTVTLEHNGSHAGTLVIPAHNVERESLRQRAEGLLTEYLEGSAAEGEAVSLGDFMFYIMAQAAQDPRE